MENNLISNALLRSLAIRVAHLWLEEEDGNSHIADMSNGVLPTSQNRQKKTKGKFKMDMRKKYKRRKGIKKKKVKKEKRIKRKRGPYRKYEERARKEPKKVERKPSGGARSWGDYKKDYDWSEHHRKQKSNKQKYETSAKGRKTRQKYYQKTKNRQKNRGGR